MLHCCNMGYCAGKCWSFPEGSADAVRFAIAGDDGPVVHILWVEERGHRPAAHGRAEYRRDSGDFLPALTPETRAAQALAYITSYLERREALSR